VKNTNLHPISYHCPDIVLLVKFSLCAIVW